MHFIVCFCGEAYHLGFVYYNMPDYFNTNMESEYIGCIATTIVKIWKDKKIFLRD